MLICYQKQTNTKQNKQIAKKYQKEKKQHEYTFYRSDLVLYTSFSQKMQVTNLPGNFTYICIYHIKQ